MNSQPQIIAFFHQSADLYGSDKVLLSLIENLDRERYEPIVVLPCHGPLCDELEKHDIQVYIAPLVLAGRALFSPVGLLKLPIALFNSIKALNEIFSGIDVAIVHSNTLAVLSGAFWSKFKRIKLLWYVHEIIERPVFVRKAFAWLLLLFADRIVCNSRATLDHLLADFGILSGKSSVVWNGIEPPALLDESHIGSPLVFAPQNVVVALVGRINRWKGHLLLMKAAKLLLEDGYSNIKYLIVGSPPAGQYHFLEKLKKVINEYSLQEYVQIVPFSDDIWPFWRQCDIAVVPSTEPEPFGLVSLEAMSVEKPVIAAGHGGLVDIVVDGETGLLFEPNNCESLKNALARLVNDENLRYSMGKKGRERVCEVFSVAKFVEKFDEEYRWVLN